MIAFIQDIIQAEDISLRLDKLAQQIKALGTQT